MVLRSTICHTDNISTVVVISWSVVRALSRLFEFRYGFGFGFGAEHAVSVLVMLQSTERSVTAGRKQTPLHQMPIFRIHLV